MPVTRRTLLGFTATIAALSLATVSAPTTASADARGNLARRHRAVATAPVLPQQQADVTMPRGGLFGASSVWRQDVSTAPLNPRSAQYVAGVTEQVTSLYNGVAAFNVGNYPTNVYTVPAGQKRVDVAWDNCQKKTWTPAGLVGAGGQFTAVPIPDGAVAANGNDKQLTVYSPETDQLWEFWQAKKVDGRWQACWGGRIDRVSTNPGYFADGFGVAATGLSFSAGAVGVKDVQAGSIDHALALQLVWPAKYTSYSWPAQRSDGYSTDPDAVPEGLRLRLDPTVDVDALHLSPIATMVARAAQKYGFIVTDKSGAVSLTAESGVPLKAATGTDPWPALMQGKAHYEVMKGFPWDRLQALPMNYGKP